jgi:hypothetical protein
MAVSRGWFSESAAQVASVGDVMFEGHWRWISNLLQATSDAVLNINRNAYPGIGGRAGSGEGRVLSEGGFRHKTVRSRFTR